MHKNRLLKKSEGYSAVRLSLIVAILASALLLVAATGVVIFRAIHYSSAAICEGCGGSGGDDGGITKGGSSTGTTTKPSSSNGTAAPADSMTITFDRSCDTYSGGVCVFNMAIGQELVIHELLSGYVYPYATNSAGWPISGITNFTGIQSDDGYTFNVSYESGADFTCKASPATAQFPSVYDPITCVHDFRGTSTPASGSADYYLKVGSNIQPGDYHFQVINVKGVSGWGANFFSFIVHIGPSANPDFNLSCDTNSVTVQQGQSANYSVRATSQNGFSGQVTVDATGGKHSTMTSTPAVLNVPAGGFANSPPVTVTTQLSTPNGTYNLTFTGTASGYPDKTCQADLIVTTFPGPAVDLIASSNSVSTDPATDSATVDLRWNISNSDTCEKTSNPANASWGSSATAVPITPADGGPVPVSLSTDTTFTITCHKGTATATDSEFVAVNRSPAFTVTPPSLSFSAAQGGPKPPAQNFTITNTGSVDLDFTISNNSPWLDLGTTSVHVTRASTAPNNVATVSMQPNTTTGPISSPDTVTFNSNSAAGSVNRPVNYVLTLPASFSMDCQNINPNTSQTKVRGETAQWSIPVIGRDGFNQTVTLQITDNTPANVTKIDGSAAFSGSPNPENHSGTVGLATGATTQTGTFNNMIVTASAPGYPSQKCTLPPLIIDAYEFDVTPLSLDFQAQQGAAVPSADYFLITNKGTTPLTFTVSKSGNSSWFDMNDSSNASIGGISVAANGGTASVKIQPTTTSNLGNFADNNLVFDSNSSSGTKTRSVTYEVTQIPPPTVSVTAECGSSQSDWTDSPTSYRTGPNPTCPLPSSGATGYIRWTSSPASNSCSVTPLSGDSMNSTNSSANPTLPVQTSALNNPPTDHQFRVRCSPDGGITFKDDIVTFNVPVGGAYNLNLSAKHAIAVNQPNLSDSQLTTANANPCDGLGHVNDATYNYKEGDIVTFAINICNTGSGDLQFPAGGIGVIKLNDILGNLAKPASGWNAKVICGTDCQMGSVDDSQAGKIIFNINSAGANRLAANNGIWTIYFNAVIVAPAGATQSYYYFSNCVANSGVVSAMRVLTISGPVTFDNPNASGSNDIPGFCLQALFSRGTAPDRHEISP